MKQHLEFWYQDHKEENYLKCDIVSERQML